MERGLMRVSMAGIDGRFGAMGERDVTTASDQEQVALSLRACMMPAGLLSSPATDSGETDSADDQGD